MTVDTSLKSQLETACKDLWWSSESDYPVEVVWHSAAELDEKEPDEKEPDEKEPDEKEMSTLLHQVIEVDGDQPLRVVEDVEGFWARSLTPQPWHTTEDNAQLAQFQQLKMLLSDSLTHLKVYRYGEIEVLIYILGRTSEGDIAGVKTCSVET